MMRSLLAWWLLFAVGISYWLFIIGTGRPSVPAFAAVLSLAWGFSVALNMLATRERMKARA